LLEFLRKERKKEREAKDNNTDDKVVSENKKEA
jgi:hypothetical protein